MKKGLAGLMTALLLVLAMGTTVFAADFPSPNNTTGLNEFADQWNNAMTDVTAVDDNNNRYMVSKKPVTAVQVSEAHKAVKETDEAGDVICMADLSVSGTVGKKGIQVTLSIPGGCVKAGYQVYVLHRLSDGRWETLKPSSVSNGKVTVTLYSLSPVAVVQYPASAAVNPSDPVKNQTGDDAGNTAQENGNSTNNNTQSSNQNNNQNNPQDNNQSNSQVQNNPVNVTVNYPVQSAISSNNSTAGSKGGSGASAAAGAYVSPKTGTSLPAWPVLAVFALAFGTAFCGKKAKNN